ncbi:MAG: peptidylprolyl isomerase, partial [Pseudomonadota bacterium]
FHTAGNGFGSTEGDQATRWFVFRVSNIKTPSFNANSAGGKKLDQQLARQIGDDIFSQYVAWLENDLGTSVNQPALAQAVGQTAPDTD